MVKGITRQVILVQSPDQTVFEQAIFIVKENAPEVTDEMLLREARKAIQSPASHPKYQGPAWAVAGAAVTGLAWLLTALL